MTVIIGEIIRKVIRDDKRSAKEISIAVGMIRGNLDKIYKKNSINTELLARFCTTLRYDFFQHVNPFVTPTEGEADVYGGEDDAGVQRSPMGKLKQCMGNLHNAQRDLEYMKLELDQIKARLADKELLISIYAEQKEGFRAALELCKSSK
jgi:DNA-binding Xre family transcriptional regulator